MRRMMGLLLISWIAPQAARAQATVPGDPLKDIHPTEKTLFVVKAGQVFKGPSR